MVFCVFSLLFLLHWVEAMTRLSLIASFFFFFNWLQMCYIFNTKWFSFSCFCFWIKIVFRYEILCVVYGILSICLWIKSRISATFSVFSRDFVPFIPSSSVTLSDRLQLFLVHAQIVWHLNARTSDFDVFRQQWHTRECFWASGAAVFFDLWMCL